MNDENKPVEYTPVTPPEPVQTPPVSPVPSSAMPKLTPNPEPLYKTSHKRSAFREALSTISILVTALIVALLIITFVFRSYQVDGPSMETALQNGDKLIIWKVPETWSKITKNDYIPNRGDVIVFNETGLGQFGQEDSKQLIKRVTGLPGERVVVKDGVVTVYNKEYPDGFQPDASLPYGKNIPTTSGNVDVTLGEGQLFVNGDNRPDSLDSRSFGPINADQVVGKLVLRVFPLSSAEIF